MTSEEEALLLPEASEAQLHSDLEDFKYLVKTAGWATLIRVLNEQAVEKKAMLLMEPLSARGEDFHTAIAAAEYDKGWLAALAFFTNLPHIQIGILVNQLGLDKPEEDEQ